MHEEQLLQHIQCIADDHPNGILIDVESSTILDCENFDEVIISHKANEPKVILPSMSGVEIHISQLEEGIAMELSEENFKEKLYTPLLVLHKLAYAYIWLRILNKNPCYVWIDGLGRLFIQ